MKKLLEKNKFGEFMYIVNKNVYVWSVVEYQIVEYIVMEKYYTKYATQIIKCIKTIVDKISSIKYGKLPRLTHTILYKYKICGIYFPISTFNKHSSDKYKSSCNKLYSKLNPTSYRFPIEFNRAGEQIASTYCRHRRFGVCPNYKYMKYHLSDVFNNMHDINNNKCINVELLLKHCVKYDHVDIIKYLTSDDITLRYPILHPDNYDKELRNSIKFTSNK
jgi:hypothetical protein